MFSVAAFLADFVHRAIKTSNDRDFRKKIAIV